jgi:tetratricopeptide (TPR) repeat protein
MGRRTAQAWILALAASITGAAETADAKPRRRDASAEFNRGVAAYQKGDFDAASAALGKSFELERDPDTLFAWAQTERKLEHCDKAIDLYEKLLGFKLPAANKEAVEQKLTECRVIIAAQQKPAEPSPGASKVEPAPVEPKPEPQPPAAGHAATAPTDAQPSARAWYKDPVGLGLVGTGVVALGVGSGFLVQGNSLDGQVANAKNWDQSRDNARKAKLYGQIGTITAAGGLALVGGGVVWIITHRHGTEHASEQPAVTGWLLPGGGGLAVTGSL